MTNKKSPPASTKGHVNNSRSLNYTSSLHSIQHISVMLADNIDSVLLALFPDKLICKNGSESRIGNNGSTVVTRTANGIIYFAHEEQQGGNIFALIQYAIACDFKSALAWAKGFLRLSRQSLSKPMLRPTKKIFVPKCTKERVSDALFYWNNSKPSSGTYAETYLRKHRSIIIPIPATIRFNVGIRNPSTKKYHPSLVAAVQDVNGKITGIHYISIDTFTCKKIAGSGVNAKISKGVIKGCAVRLSPADTEIVVCEGIEDGLSLLQLNPNLCVWSGLGGNIRNVEFPPEVTKVTIAADNDIAGRANALKLYSRLKSNGIDVSIIYPPQGFKDFNDYLQGGK